MAFRSENVRDDDQRPVSGAKVYVFNHDDNQLADLTSQAGDPIANPIITGESGEYSYSVPDGLYNEQVVFGGRLRRIENKVQVGTFILEGQVVDINNILGVDIADGDLGAFTGTIIPDDSSVKEAFQSLETAVPEIAIEDTRPEIATQSKPVAILSGETDHGLFIYDSRTPVASHQDPYRYPQFIAPNALANGALKIDRLNIPASAIGLSPNNTAAQNMAAYNVWRDAMGDLQTRQNPVPLTLDFDEAVYPFSGTIEVWQQRVILTCSAGIATLDFTTATAGNGGIRVTHRGSVNQNRYSGVRNIVCINPKTANGIECINSPYVVVDNCEVVGATGGGYNFIGPISPTITNNRAYGNAGRGITVEAGIVSHPNGPTLVVPFDVTVDGFDAQGNGSDGGLFAECISVNVTGFKPQVNGGTGGRGISFERCLGVNYVNCYHELNRFDVVLNDTKRIQQVLSRAGTTAIGSPVITGIDVTSFYIGMTVSGAGVPIGATIIPGGIGATSITISANCTANGTPTLSLGYDAPFGHCNIQGAYMGGEQVGGSVPISILVQSDYPHLTIGDGRYGGDLNISTAGSTGYISKNAVFLGSKTNISPGVVDFSTMFDASGIKLPAGDGLFVGGVQVVGAQQAAITAPTGGVTIDAEARTAINAIRAALTAHGLTA